MRPRRTHESNKVYRLPGGNEDNDLWVQVTEDESEVGGETQSATPVIRSTWVPTEEERHAIANGSNIELYVWGTAQPPVAVEITDVPLGKAP